MNAPAHNLAPDHLWRIIDHPERPGLFMGFGKYRNGREVTIESDSRETLENTLVEMQLQLHADGEDRFLSAWKHGVQLAGPDLFSCERGHSKPASVEEATSKWQLIPNWDRVEDFFRSGASANEQRFLMAMCSFYNTDWMTEWAAKKRWRLTPGSLASRLDADRLAVLADLLTSYRGW